MPISYFLIISVGVGEYFLRSSSISGALFFATFGGPCGLHNVPFLKRVSTGGLPKPTS
jgi:hypothetical protein